MHTTSVSNGAAVQWLGLGAIASVMGVAYYDPILAGELVVITAIAVFILKSCQQRCCKSNTFDLSAFQIDFTNDAFQMQEHTTVQYFDGLIWDGPIKTELALEIILPRTQVISVAELIKFAMEKRVICVDPAKKKAFDPKVDHARAVTKEAAAKKEDPTELMSEFVLYFTFKELSDVFRIDFKPPLEGSFSTSLSVSQDASPAITIGDGIIDLTPYYDPISGERKQAKYRVKCMTVYTSDGIEKCFDFIRSDGKYFGRKNGESNQYREITKEEFHCQKRLSSIILERLKA